jgi:hypothetical protein
VSNAGNSHQRKMVKKAEERIAKAVTGRVLENMETPIHSSSDGVEPVPPRLSSKLGTFWGSTPAWTGIGMLVGVFAPLLSLQLLFVGVWGIFFFEFIRVGFFKGKVAKWLGNAVAGCVFAVVFFVVWKVSPRPKQPPTLDQEMSAFAQKFPWIASAPPQAGPVIPVAITQGTVWMSDSFFSSFYWMRFNATNKITPINVLADYTITSVRPMPILIKRVSLEILGAHNTWWPLANLPSHQLIWSADRAKAPTDISLIELPDGFLIDKLSNNEVKPGHSVSGWLLCQIPSDYVPPKVRMSAQLRLRVKDTAGDEAIQPLEGPITSDDNVMPTLMRVSPVRNENLMTYEVTPYGGGSNSF